MERIVSANIRQDAEKQNVFARKSTIFECEICMDTFTQQLKFFEHLKSHYDREKNTECVVQEDELRCEDGAASSELRSGESAAGLSDYPSVVEANPMSSSTNNPIQSGADIPNTTASYTVQSDKNFELCVVTPQVPSTSRLLTIDTAKDITICSNCNCHYVKSVAHVCTSSRQPATRASQTLPEKQMKPPNRKQNDGNKTSKKDVLRKSKNAAPATRLEIIEINPDGNEAVEELDEEDICQYELEDEGILPENYDEYMSGEEGEYPSVPNNKSDDKSKGKRLGHRRSEVLKCPHCQRVFNHRNSLVYHLRSHTGERPHLCQMCGKRFFATSALKVHMRLHSGEKPYNCEACDKSFRQWGDLKYHRISIHSDIRQYQCEFCGKDFARKYSLIVHRRIHTGERNYKCEFCMKCFRAASYLQNHRRIHTGEKPHACSICGKPFRVRSDMKRHMASHSREIQHLVTNTERSVGEQEPVGKVLIRRSQPSAASTSKIRAFEQSGSRENEIYRSTNEEEVETVTVLPAVESPISFTHEEYQTQSKGSVAPESDETQSGVFHPGRSRASDTITLGNNAGTLFVWPVFVNNIS